MTSDGFSLLRQYALDQGWRAPFSDYLDACHAAATASEDIEARGKLVDLLKQIESLEGQMRCALSNLTWANSSSLPSLPSVKNPKEKGAK